MKLRNARFLEFLKFSGCTFLAYLLDIAVFAVLYEWLGLLYILAKGISYTAGVITSYTLNRKITFGGDRKYVSSTLIQFLLLNCISLGVSLGSLYLFVDVCHFYVWIGYFLSGACSFCTNYTGNRCWVFRKRGSK